MFYLKHFLFHPDAGAVGGEAPSAQQAAAGQQAPATPPAQQAADKTDDGEKKTEASKKPQEKTFTQDELNKILQERLARARVSFEDPAKAEANAEDQMKSQLAAIQSRLVQTEVKAQMALNGVQTEKVERACRLVDLAKCTDKTGMPDAAKITAEIEALVKDFPELKATSAEGAAGFKIGADGGKSDKNKPSSAELDEIFGVKT